MRYAHSDGHTVLCFEETGRYMLTGGTDGDVRVWEGIEDDDAVSHRIGDRVYAIAFKNGRFFTASEGNSIQTHLFPDGSPDGIVTRFTAPVTHMCINKAGTAMVAGSSDFTLKLIDIASSDQKVFHGHEAPVLSVALHPKEELVASSSCDGSVRVWNIESQSCVKVWTDVHPKSSDISLSKTLCRLSWSPDGKLSIKQIPLHSKNVVAILDVTMATGVPFLVVPGASEIAVYSTNTWDKTVIKDSGFSKMISTLSFSPNGQHLAASSVDGTVFIISWADRTVNTMFRHEKGLNISALAWNPGKTNELAFCDTEGQLGVKEVQIDTTGSKTAAENRGENQFAGVFDDDDDMLLEASHGPSPMIDDEASKESMQDVIVNKKMNVLGDSDDDDDDGDFLKDIKQLPRDDDDASSVTDSLGPAPLPPPVDLFKPTPLQRPFQPGSTPTHLSNRFMMWNDVGMVKQFVSEEENSIDVEFHNTSTHHAMHLTNSLDCNIADLSTEALIMACPADDDTPSKVMCMHFGSWDSSKEWTVALPEGEEAQALTAGEGWVAVATDARNVRIFSVGGIQQDMFSIPGPVVCVAAHRGQMLVVYHAGMGVHGDQSLAISLLCVRGRKKCVMNGTPLPLSPKSTLQWIGFSQEGTPFYMDSAGIVRMRNRQLGSSWVQVADTRENVKGKSDHNWIVGVSEHPQQLRCILCKGSRYPPTLPRPTVSVLPFSIPLCEMNTEKSQYEETLLRTHLFAGSLAHDEDEMQDALRPAQEALMKLFALSTRSEREARALEVCELMTDEHTLQLAIKYASRLKHILLAERISELAQRRAEGEEEREEPEYEDEGDEVETATSARVANGDHGEEEEVVEEEQQEEEDNQGETEFHSLGPRLNLQPREQQAAKNNKSVLSRSNPFKVASQQKTSHPTKGSQVFDKIPSKPEKSEKVLAPLPVTIRTNKTGAKKTKTINNMFAKSSGEQSLTKFAEKTDIENGTESQNSKPSVTGFQLWLTENRDELGEECPDLSEEDLNQMAAERFRSLPKEERQSWSAKAKGGSENSPDARKRKRSEGQETEQSTKKRQNIKKPLSQNTNAKLSSFTFSKD